MKDMSFKIYVETIKEKALEFEEGLEWDIDQWNESYIDFKEGVAVWKQEYKSAMSGKEMAIEWAREFYQDADSETHDYWVVKKCDGWYCARTSKPKHNVGVFILIPAEDNHITSGMYDISEDWVILDDYRVSSHEVRAWRYLPELPSDKEFLTYFK